MNAIDCREALSLYSDDPRYPAVCRHLHPTVDGAALAVNDDADDELLAMVTLGALCAGKSVMIAATAAGTRHTQAVLRVTLVAQACGRTVTLITGAKYTLCVFDTVAAAA